MWPNDVGSGREQGAGSKVKGGESRDGDPPEARAEERCGAEQKCEGKFFPLQNLPLIKSNYFSPSLNLSTCAH